MFAVREVCKTYQGHQVLSPVSFVLPEGQCLGIAGSNGSGKSTLLRILAQIQPPDSGDILFDGVSVLGDRRFLRTQLGYVPQDNELIPDLTVLQQLRLWQRACGLRGPIPGDVSELLGLEALLPKQIKNLSGGMQRRVSIALALLSKPRVLIMDEATTGLDQSYCPHLLDYLEQFLHHGGSLIWCSHHPQELSRLCGSCLYIQNGNPSFYVPHPGTPTNQ